MRARLLLAALVAVLLGVVLMRDHGSGAAARPPASRAPVPPPARLDAPAPSLPERNVFEYAPGPERPPAAAETAPTTLAPAAASPGPPAAPPTPVRLVGVLRRGGEPRAALSIDGEVVIVPVGEESRGYRVISIDDDVGVVLRGPDGSELTLVAPPR